MDFIFFWLFMSALTTFILWLLGFLCLAYDQSEDARVFFRLGFLSWLWPIAMVAGVVIFIASVVIYTLGLDKRPGVGAWLRRVRESARI